MIRIPEELHRRLDRIADEILASKERAQDYNDVPLVEQGERGTWVSHAAVISRALDEFEKHRMRSNPRNRIAKPQ